MMNIRRCGSEKNYGIDRISSLHDDVLTHILSFLSIRKAVQTCILSKRWINTWASVPDLEFDIKEFGLPKIVDDDMAIEFVTKFELLVKNVLEKQETSCVNRFRLWLDSGVYWPCTQAVAGCIGDAMKLEPRECSVKLRSCGNLNLNTDLIFTCASLIYLQLWLSIKVCPFVAIEPKSINLPCLKTLELDGVRMSGDSLKKLLLGCPVLEELVLEDCYISFIEICSNTLKKLVLSNNYHIMRLDISTPNLLYFEIHVLDMREISLLNMPSLVDAFICLSDWYSQDKYITQVPKLISSLSNVKSLNLQFLCSGVKVLETDFSNCPVFNNLKRLELMSWGLYIGFDFFLHHSPKLQELTFDDINALLWECLDEERTQEGPRDALVQRQFLKSVRIVESKNDIGIVDQLINKLLAHVKIIGEITQWFAPGYPGYGPGTPGAGSEYDGRGYGRVRGCLVQVVEWSPDGAIKSIRVHDLLREVALGEATENDFLLIWKEENVERDVSMTRQVAFHEGIDAGSSIFDPIDLTKIKMPKLRTFLNDPALLWECLDEERTQEGPRDALVQWLFLKSVRIVESKNDIGIVDQLINKLLVLVKITGEITRV